MDNTAIDTAARFGEIPFVEFTQELVTGIFNSLVDAHILQMEEYANFVNSLTQDLSTYINNTMDGVSFEQITDFVLAYELQEVSEASFDTIIGALETPTSSPVPVPSTSTPADSEQWWGGLINGLAPAVNSLVDKISDPGQIPELNAIADYNNGVISTVPSYEDISGAVAALISSNKYALLQNMAQQGAMRVVVTSGEIETKLTFSTWNENSRGYETTYKRKVKDRYKEKNKTKNHGGILGIFRLNRERNKTNRKTRTVTINTAKSYQRDTSGTKVDVFGRVLINFKTDYAPLNG